MKRQSWYFQGFWILTVILLVITYCLGMIASGVWK